MGFPIIERSILVSQWVHLDEYVYHKIIFSWFWYGKVLTFGSVILAGDLLGLTWKGNPVPLVAGFVCSSSGLRRTSVLSSSSSLRVGGTWFTFNSDHSCSLACRLLRVVV